MSIILSTQNLTKVYKLGETQVNALNNVNVQIHQGEFIAITGASGSGKSTLMNMLGLLDSPTSGKIYLDKKDVSSLSEDKQAELRNKYIGFVFQSFNLLKKTTAMDNVELPLLYAGTSKSARRKKAIEMLTKVGLGNRLDHTSNQLSGGQQQRVAIARALINDPKLILADEPTGNLDSRSGEEIMKLFHELNIEGKTIILVTHELDIAQGTKRIIEMKDGQVITDTKLMRRLKNNK